MYNWDWGVIWEYRSVFVQGALLTLWLTLLSVAISTILGIVLMFLRRSKIQLISLVSAVYTQVFRSVPVLAMILFVYYVLPITTGLTLSAFNSVLLATVATLVPFMSELIRTGIESVPRGQYESGAALGISHFQVMRSIVIPQIYRNIMSNYVGYVALVLKNTSLASIIGVNELLHRGNLLISNTSRSLEVFIAVALVYVAITLPILLLADYLEKKLKTRERSV